MDRKSSSAIVALERELERKVERRDELNKPIFEPQHKIMELKRPLPLTPLARTKLDLSGVGLIEAIRILLHKHGQPMTEAEVLHGLNALGFDVKRFKSPASAVHNILLGMASRRQLLYRGQSRAYEVISVSEADKDALTNTPCGAQIFRTEAVPGWGGAKWIKTLGLSSSAHSQRSKKTQTSSPKSATTSCARLGCRRHSCRVRSTAVPSSAA